MAEKIRVGIERYLQVGYDALVKKNPDVIYLTTDTQRIYLGAKLFAEGSLSFTNTGSGWRVEKRDGERFVHTDNDSVIDANDHVLVVEKDTEDEEVDEDLTVGPIWRTIFSSDTPRLEYADDYRLAIDTETGKLININLIIDTDDPKTPIEAHQIVHLATNLGGGKYEFELAKYDLEGKKWRIEVQSKMLWRARLFAFRWGHTGGFRTILGLEYDEESNDIFLTGIDGYVIDQVHTIVSHDGSIVGEGSGVDPLKVVNHPYMNSTVNVEKIQISQRNNSELVLDIVAGAPDGTRRDQKVTVASKDVQFVIEGDRLGIKIPQETLKTYHDDSLVGDGVKNSPLKVAFPLKKEGTGVGLETLSGKFKFSDNAIDFLSDSNKSIKIGDIDLSDAVDDLSVKFKDGVLVSEAFVYWDQEKTLIKFRRQITQVQYDQLVTDNKVSEDTIYYTLDTFRIYVGTLLYTKDYTSSGDIPIMYETTWVPTFPQWAPNKFYETNTLRMYDDRYYRCKASHMAKDDWDPVKWGEFDAPEETQIRRVINEGPNDFQIAFMRYVAEYPVNEHWMTEHTFNFKIVADPNDPDNKRGHAQFLVDNEEITFRPQDYVRTDGTDQEIAGIKDFTGDVLVLTEPPTERSAINDEWLQENLRRILGLAEEEYSRIWEKMALGSDLKKVISNLRRKSDKWYAQFPEKDVGDLVAGDLAYIIRFPENPSIDSNSTITFFDPDIPETSVSLKSENYREYVVIDGEEHEFFNDGTETWAEAWITDEVEYDPARRELKFYTPLFVKDEADNWHDSWGGRDIVALIPGLPVVDCRYNYELIQALQNFAADLDERLDEEIKRAKSAEEFLGERINVEISDREYEDGVLQAQIDDEVLRATAEEARIESESVVRDEKVDWKINEETRRATSEETRIESESKERDLQVKADLTNEIARVERESAADRARIEGESKDRDDALDEKKLDVSRFESYGKYVTEGTLEVTEDKVSVEFGLNRLDAVTGEKDSQKVKLYNSDGSIIIEKTKEGVDIRVFDLYPDLPDRPNQTNPGRYIMKLTKDYGDVGFTWLPVTQDMYAINGLDELSPVNMIPGVAPRPNKDGRFALSYIQGLEGYTDGFYWMPVRDELHVDQGEEIFTEIGDNGLNTPDYPEGLFGKWALVVTQRGPKAFLVWEDIVDSLYIDGKTTIPVLPELPKGEGDWVLAFSRHGTNETLYWAEADRQVG
jgi:hypothetical protein